MKEPAAAPSLPAATDDDIDVDHWLTVNQTCAYLGISRPTLHRWSRDGTIPLYRLGTKVNRYRRQDLDRLTTNPAAPPLPAATDDDRADYWLTVNQTCAYLGIHRNTLACWSRDGTVPTFRRFTAPRYRRRDLDRLFERVDVSGGSTAGPNAPAQLVSPDARRNPTGRNQHSKNRSVSA